MNKSTSRTVRLGVFVIVGSILFSGTAYLIGQKQDMFRDTFTVHVRFNNVNGLQTGNNVRFSGITIGSVTAVSITSDSSVQVSMRIRESVRMFIKQDAMASIGSDGLMGNMLVNISAGHPNSPPATDGDFLSSYSRIKTDDILKTLNLTNENAAMLTSNLLEVTQQIKHGKGTLTYLLYDSSLRNDLGQSIVNLRNASQQTNALLQQTQRVMKEIANGKGTLSWLLNDTTLAPQVSQTFSDLQKTSAKINRAADSLHVFVSKLNQESGLVNTLIRDTLVAQDFRQTLHHLNQSSVKLNENMEAMRHHVLFKGYFKDKEKRAVKPANQN